jgi:hypothetical protein
MCTAQVDDFRPVASHCSGPGENAEPPKALNIVMVAQGIYIFKYIYVINYSLRGSRSAEGIE